MYQRADDAVVLQKMTGIFHRRGAAVFLIPPYDGSDAGLLLPVIFPADALKKQEEIQSLQRFRSRAYILFSQSRNVSFPSR